LIFAFTSRSYKKAKDMEGRTPMFHTIFHKAKAVAKLLQPFED